MIKNEPKSLTPLQILLAIVLCRGAMAGMFVVWWHGNDRKNPAPVKYSTVDILQGIHYIDFALYPSPLAEYNVEDYWSSRAAGKHRNQEDDNAPTDISTKPSSYVPFGLPVPGNESKGSDIAPTSSYLKEALRKRIVIQGFEIYLSGDDHFTAKASDTGLIDSNIRMDKQRGYILFQIHSLYRQRLRLHNQSDILPVTLVERSSPVYIVKEDSAVLSIKSVLQEQIKDIITLLRKTTLESDHSLVQGR